MNAEFVGQDRIRIISIVKALKSFGDTVEEAIAEDNFDKILLSITDEEVDGLREFLKHPIEVEMDDVEIIYEYHMRGFGTTSIPPEAFIRAINMADRKNIELSGIDIPSGTYEDLFVKNVKLSDILFLGFKKKRLLKRRWNRKSPELFSVQWDRYISKGGYLKLEKARSEYMASAVSKEKGHNTLVIVEVERFSELVEGLSGLLQGYKLQENLEGTKVASLSGPS